MRYGIALSGVALIGAVCATAVMDHLLRSLDPSARAQVVRLGGPWAHLAMGFGIGAVVYLGSLRWNSYRRWRMPLLCAAGCLMGMGAIVLQDMCFIFAGLGLGPWMFVLIDRRPEVRPAVR